MVWLFSTRLHYQWYKNQNHTSPTKNHNKNKTTTQPKIKDLILKLKTINQTKTTPKTIPKPTINNVQTLKQNYSNDPSTPKLPTITNTPSTPKPLNTTKPKLLIQTPSSQKRKLSNDMELETPISHSKTRLLDTPVRKGSKTPAKYDFQAKTKLIFKESEDFLYKGDEEYILKPP